MSEPEEETDDADLTVALDIIDLRTRTLEIASAHDDWLPETVVVAADYYFRFCLTGLIVPYPPPPDGAKPKPKLVK
jgi:hypothetical protein